MEAACPSVWASTPIAVLEPLPAKNMLNDDSSKACATAHDGLSSRNYRRAHSPLDESRSMRMSVRLSRSVFLALAFGAAQWPCTLPAQRAESGARARAAARTYREHNEAEIINEFAALLALPNLATDSANIRRNADLLVQMLEHRGFRNTRLLTVPGGPPAVYGELPSPGATRTLVLYAHYDG